MSPYLDRRDFIKPAGTLIAGASFGSCGLAEPASAPAGSGRLVLPMNRNWRYSRQAVEGAHEKEFDESKFETVVTPHTNVRLPWHGFDDKEYEFISQYRRRFKL